MQSHGGRGATVDVLTCARQLARAIQESAEFQAYQEARRRVEADPTTRAMVHDFRQKSLDLQRLQWSGQEPERERLSQLESLFELLNYNPTARELLDAEVKLATLVAEAQKIISDAVDVWPELSGQADGKGETEPATPS